MQWEPIKSESASAKTPFDSRDSQKLFSHPCRARSGKLWRVCAMARECGSPLPWSYHTTIASFSFAYSFLISTPAYVRPAWSFANHTSPWSRGHRDCARPARARRHGAVHPVHHCLWGTPPLRCAWAPPVRPRGEATPAPARAPSNRGAAPPSSLSSSALAPGEAGPRQRPKGRRCARICSVRVIGRIAAV